MQSAIDIVHHNASHGERGLNLFDTSAARPTHTVSHYHSESRPSFGSSYSGKVTTHNHGAVPSKYHDTTVATGNGLPDSKVTYSVISEQTAEAQTVVSEPTPVVVQRVERVVEPAPVVVQRALTMQALYTRSEPVVVSTSTRPADVRVLPATCTVAEHIPLDPKTYPRMSDDQWFAATRFGDESSSRHVSTARPITSSSYTSTARPITSSSYTSCARPSTYSTASYSPSTYTTHSPTSTYVASASA